jgi:hypothetical protein
MLVTTSKHGITSLKDLIFKMQIHYDNFALNGVKLMHAFPELKVVLQINCTGKEKKREKEKT